MKYYPNKLGKKTGKGPWSGELGKLVTHEKLKPPLPCKQHINSFWKGLWIFLEPFLPHVHC